MSRRGDSSRAGAQRNQQTLQSLLKLEPNKMCADCKIHKRTFHYPFRMSRFPLRALPPPQHIN